MKNERFKVEIVNNEPVTAELNGMPVVLTIRNPIVEFIENRQNKFYAVKGSQWFEIQFGSPEFSHYTISENISNGSFWRWFNEALNVDPFQNESTAITVRYMAEKPSQLKSLAQPMADLFRTSGRTHIVNAFLGAIAEANKLLDAHETARKATALASQVALLLRKKAEEAIDYHARLNALNAELAAQIASYNVRTEIEARLCGLGIAFGALAKSRAEISEQAITAAVNNFERFAKEALSNNPLHVNDCKISVSDIIGEPSGDAASKVA